VSRFDDTGVERVHHVAGVDVQAGADIAVVVGRPEVDERVDGVQSGVARERSGDDFEGVRKGLDGQLLAALDAIGVVTQAAGDFDFGGTAAAEDAALGDGGRHHVQRVLHAAFEFVDDVVGRATQEQRDAVGVLVGALDVEQPLVLVARDRTLPEVGLAGRVEVGDDVRTEQFLQELDVGLLGPLDREDALLSEVVLGHVVDVLLAEQDVRAGGLDLVGHLLELFFLLVEEVLELARVVDGELGVHIGLVELDGSVHQQHLGVFDRGRHLLVDGVFVDDRAFEQFGVAGGAPGLGLDVEVLEVDNVVAGVGLDGDRVDGVDDDLGEQFLVEFRALAGHRGLGDLPEQFLVVRVDLGRDVRGFGFGLRRGHVEPFDDGRRVDVLVEQVLGVLEEFTRDGDGRCGAVAGLVFLCLCDLDDHRGRRVVDVHLLKDGDAVVRDGYVAHRGDEHLVHPLGPERRADRLRDRAGGRDVVFLCRLVFHPLGVLSQNYHRLALHLSLAHNQPNDCLWFYIKVWVERLGTGPGVSAGWARNPETTAGSVGLYDNCSHVSGTSTRSFYIRFRRVALYSVQRVGPRRHRTLVCARLVHLADLFDHARRDADVVCGGVFRDAAVDVQREDGVERVVGHPHLAGVGLAAPHLGARRLLR